MDNFTKGLLPIKTAILEMQQPRSRFQLERFVIGQHLTPEMQYYQVCIELQDMLFRYEEANISMQIQEKKIAKLRSTNDEIDELKAKKLELNLEQMEITIVGAQREIAHLIDLWHSFEHKYSREEIEMAQPDYWEARLVNNAKAMIMGGAGVSPAHLEAMEQAGVLDKFVEQRIEAERELRNLES
jgi:hypothetical protein